RESERRGHGQKRQQRPDQYHGQRSNRQRKARTAAKGIPGRTYDEQHKRLGRERFDKPARVEKLFAGMKYFQQQKKSQEIINGANRAYEYHKFSDQADVQALRLLYETGIDVVGRDRDLRKVVKEIIEQYLGRQHGQKRQK